MLTGVILAAALLLVPVSATAAERFATSVARGATGTTCSQGSPCTVKTCLSQTSAGDICTLEGRAQDQTPPWFVYSHADDMIDPTDNALSGTAVLLITVRASVDGGVLLDGQFTRGTVVLESGNSWWVIEGINARNSTKGAYYVRGSNNIVRRAGGWDNIFYGGGGATFNCQTTGADNLFEDVFAFGIGAWHFTHSQNKNGPCTFRRAWGRFEATANGQNNGTVFGGLFYNADRSTCENCIAEYSAAGGPASTYLVTNPTPTSEGGCPNGVCSDGAPPWPGGGANINRYDGTEPSGGFNGQMLGSLLYARDVANLSRMTVGSINPSMVFGSVNRTGGGMTFRDVLIYVDPNHANFSSMRALDLRDRNTTNGSFVTDVSTVAGQSNSIDTNPSWTVTGLVHASSLEGLNSASANPWSGTSGANLCFRYVNRGKTNQKLWPWPMNDRIKKATANAGAYTGPCFHGSDTDLNGSPACGAFPTRTEFDLQAWIEFELGAIPAECGGGQAPPVTPPAGPVVQYVIDEAASGQTPTAVLDSASGTALDLGLTYGTP